MSTVQGVSTYVALLRGVNVGGRAAELIVHIYIEKRLGVVGTTRNWGTVTKLHELARTP